MVLSVDEIVKRLNEVSQLVSAAEDRKEDRDFLSKTHIAVEELAAIYREHEQKNGIDPMVDRKVGRRVRDIRRQASLLPRIGEVAPSTPDRQIEGLSMPQERKITGVSWQNGNARLSSTTEYKVGGDIDAYCGTCKESSTHSIIAVVDEAPKKVVCQVCGARHNYRSAPARARTKAVEEEEAPRLDAESAEREKMAAKKRAEKNSLMDEIGQCENVKTFSGNGHYKVGDIIEHPLFGLGKVETALRSSILVRFAQGGLKSIMMI